MIRDKNHTLLNVNDCVLEDPPLVHNINKYMKNEKIDVLLTQFSYASFADGETRASRAKNQLEAIKLQDSVLKPTNIIPFASFIYFSHEENFYMNDSINTPEIVEEYLYENTDSNSIWLKPNEKWNVGSVKNNNEAINFWMEIYNNVVNFQKLVLLIQSN